MNANLNSISPLLSDVKTTPKDKPVSNDLKKDYGPTFGSVLSKAEGQQTESQGVEESAPRLPKPMKVHGEDEKQEKLVNATEKSPMDDKTGIIAKSFDHMAVSYPVSRIAHESLDEKTVTNLKDQGLWEIPSMVMAEPNPLAVQQL